MEFNDVIEILWRRKFIIIVTVALGIGGAFFFVNQLEDDAYVAAIFRASTPSVGEFRDTVYADRLNNTYRFIVNSTSVQDELKARTGIEEVPETTVTGIANTELLELRMITADLDVLQAMTDLLIERSDELYFGEGQLTPELLEREIEIAATDLTLLAVELGMEELTPAGEEAETSEMPTRADLSIVDQVRLQSAEERLRGLLEEDIRSDADLSEEIQLATDDLAALTVELGLEEAEAVDGVTDEAEEEAITREDLSVVDQVRLQSAESRLSGLLTEQTRLQRIELEQAVNLTLVEIDDEPNLDSPPRMLLLALSGMLAMAAGVGLALVGEATDSKLYTTKQIEELVDAHAIGRIPPSRSLRRGMPSNSDMRRRQTQKFPTIEAFRYLRTTLLRKLEESKGGHTIAMASSASGEGRSTMVANLARSLAAAGYRVLVIDADMRSPQQHKIFRMPNTVGLSNVLLKHKRLSQAVQYHEPTHVYVLPNGPHILGSADLIGSQRMRSLLKHIDLVFDIVLVDLPALTSVADGMALVGLADESLFIVTRKRSRRDIVLIGLQQLAQAGIHPLGLIINRAERNVKKSYDKRQPANSDRSIVRVIPSSPGGDDNRVRKS